MFENILGQNNICKILKTELKEDKLPGSILFEGSQYSAKLSTALELARCLSCEKDADWNCQCPSCVRHRALSHQDLLIMGPKSFYEELSIGLKMLEVYPGSSSRFFFSRAAKKLTRRFDDILYTDEEAKLGKANPLIRSIAEGVNICLPTSNYSDEEVLKEASKLVPLCAKLEDMIPAKIPLFQIRAMEYWSHLSAFGKKKVIIIEHADMMLDSSRNALLKIIEEPPKHCVFILTTNRRQAMIETILSRVRKYHFISRNASDSKLVLKRVFHVEDEKETNIYDYISSFKPSSILEIERIAQEFIASIVYNYEKNGNELFDKALIDLTKNAKDIKSVLKEISEISSDFGSQDSSNSYTFQTFIDGGVKAFAKLIKNPDAGIQTIRLSERYLALSRDALNRNTSYNINANSLVYRLADSFSNTKEV